MSNLIEIQEMIDIAIVKERKRLIEEFTEHFKAQTGIPPDEWMLERNGGLSVNDIAMILLQMETD